MEKIKITFFVGLALVLSSTFALATPIAPIDKSTATEIEQALDKDNLERELGRKLNFVERIALKRAKKKFKKQTQRDPGEKASGLAIAAVVLGSVALPLLLVPYIGILGFFSAIAATVTGAVAQDKSGSKTDKFGKIGMWLGISSLILILLVLIWAWTIILAWAA